MLYFKKLILHLPYFNKKKSTDSVCIQIERLMYTSGPIGGTHAQTMSRAFKPRVYCAHLAEMFLCIVE